MSDIKWGSATTLKFVEEYGKHRCLWDTEDQDYRNKEVRDAALNDIATEMNIDGFDVDAVKRKIRIIRSTYWNEKIKIQRRANSCYKPKIKWYAVANSFLQTTKNWREFDAQLELENVDTKDETFKLQHNDETSNETDQETSVKETPPKKMIKLIANTNTRSHSLRAIRKLKERQQAIAATTTVTTTPTTQIKRKSKDLLNEAAKALIHDLKKNDKSLKNNDDCNDEDEFDLFGKTIACQLKKLPIIDAIELQTEIQQLILQRRLIFLQNKNSS